MIDGLPSLANRFGKSFFLFVEEAPLALLVHLDEMSQGAPGTEQLPFGVVALDFRGAGFGHWLAVSPKDVNIKSKRV
jgi:hypothetical protein